jgi:hypothetical protein
MSFFEPPPPPPPEPPEPPRRPWHGPPDATVGRALALNLVLGRSGKAALWIPSLGVYPDGFELSVEIRHRLDEDELEHPFFMHLHLHRRRRRPPGEQLDPELVRLGIEFADGRRATNLDERMPFALPGEPDEPPTGPVLAVAGGGGGGGRWHANFWVWPLPPEGPLAFVCEWPVAGIPETRREIDSAPIRDAAAAAVVLWADERRGGPGGITTFQRMRASSTSAPPEPRQPADPDLRS